MHMAKVAGITPPGVTQTHSPVKCRMVPPNATARALAWLSPRGLNLTLSLIIARAFH